jgi:hypothetical protein
MVRYRRPAETWTEKNLMELSTVQDAALMKSFTGMTVRVLRNGRDLTVLVYEARDRRALLEDAGCTATLNMHRWSTAADRCEVTLVVTTLCAQ